MSSARLSGSSSHVPYAVSRIHSALLADRRGLDGGALLLSRAPRPSPAPTSGRPPNAIAGRSRPTGARPESTFPDPATP